MVNLASDSWTKYYNFKLKSRKDSCPQKVVFIFCRNFAGNFFRRRRIFVDFKTEFWKISRSQAYIPISRWCYGEHFLRKFIRKPRLCSRRWSESAKNKARFGFAAKKIQCWFFLWRYMKDSPLEIKKKLLKFGFWLISFRLQKTEWSFKATHEQ